MFTNASGMEEEPLKLLIQEKGIGNVYNNVNGNALVLCPYFGCMRAEPRFDSDFTISKMKCVQK